MNWYLDVLKKYAVFQGRARRKEYWMFTLFNVIISIILSLIDFYLLDSQVLESLYALAVLIPSLAVTVRRLHDIGKIWAWILLCLIPIIGQIWLLVLMCTNGNVGDNDFGSDPKATIQ